MKAQETIKLGDSVIVTAPTSDAFKCGEVVSIGGDGKHLVKFTADGTSKEFDVDDLELDLLPF